MSQKTSRRMETVQVMETTAAAQVVDARLAEAVIAQAQQPMDDHAHLVVGAPVVVGLHH